MTREELQRTAKENIQRRRQKAQVEAQRTQQKLLEEVPGYAELEQQRAAAGARAARLAVEGDAQKAQAQLELIQDIAARRALLLAQHGYAEDANRPRFACAKCEDTGRGRDGRACICLQQELRALRRQQVNEQSPLTLCRFDTFILDKYPEQMDGVFTSPRAMMAGVLQDCRDYAADFGPRSESLFMYGDAGLGKTHLALSIAGEVLDKGFDVIYVSAQSAFAEVSSTRFERGGAAFPSMMGADLLVLDDLGTEYLDAYVLSRLYELVNSRVGKPTIYTSNIVSQELLVQRYTEKIASRLLGECCRMRFVGKDIRLMR